MDFWRFRAASVFNKLSSVQFKPQPGRELMDSINPSSAGTIFETKNLNYCSRDARKPIAVPVQ